MIKKNAKIRVGEVSEEKKKVVLEITNKLKKYKTLLITSTKGLPSAEFHKIKKSLRGIVEIVVAKKTLILKAISNTEKGTLQKMKEKITSDVALMFSNIEPFELASILMDNQTPIRARVGDIAPEDINVEPGPTDLVPGPAISELGSVGLKVAVEGGKLVIKNSVVIVKNGEKINEKVSNVLGKLKILPMKVGFVPVCAYDSVEDKIYDNIVIDKKGTLEELRMSISKALSFAVNMCYTTKETITFLIGKAALHERVIQKIIKEET